MGIINRILKVIWFLLFVLVFGWIVIFSPFILFFVEGLYWIITGKDKDGDIMFSVSTFLIDKVLEG